MLHSCYLNLDYVRDIAGGSTFAEISKKACHLVSIHTGVAEGSTRDVRASLSPRRDRLVVTMKGAVTLRGFRDPLLSKLDVSEIRGFCADLLEETSG